MQDLHIGGLCDHRLEQSRLPDTRLSAQQQYAALAITGPIEQRHERAALRHTPQQPLSGS